MATHRPHTKLELAGRIGELGQMSKQPESRASPRLSRYVGVKEVCVALGISKPTLDRLRRDGKFPPHEQLSPNRVGWRTEVIEAHLAGQARSVSSLSVGTPGDLEPDQLEDQARIFAAQAHAKRTGKPVDHKNLALHPTQRLTEEEFVALETAEHQVRAEYLSRLPDDQAMVVVAALLPQLRRDLAKIAGPRAREVLLNPELVAINFQLISDFLTLFELETRLAEGGLRFAGGRTVLERLSEFDQGRAFVLSAWLFPALRPIIVASAANAAERELFADPNQLRDLAMAALNDEKWAERQAELLARQRAEQPSGKPPPTTTH